MSIQECRSVQDPASFRDPSGYVFRKQDRIFRAIDGECRKSLQRLVDEGSFTQLIEKKLIVGSRFVEEPNLLDSLANEHPGYEHFLEHDLIAPITYPYEWTI